MNILELEKIDADVVIVLINKESNRMEVHPFWEFDGTPTDLLIISAKLGLEFNESCGCGHTEIELYDFREAALAS